MLQRFTGTLSIVPAGSSAYRKQEERRCSRWNRGLRILCTAALVTTMTPTLAWGDQQSSSDETAAISARSLSFTLEKWDDEEWGYIPVDDIQLDTFSCPICNDRHLRNYCAYRITFSQSISDYDVLLEGGNKEIQFSIEDDGTSLLLDNRDFKELVGSDQTQPVTVKLALRDAERTGDAVGTLTVREVETSYNGSITPIEDAFALTNRIMPVDYYDFPLENFYNFDGDAQVVKDSHDPDILGSFTSENQDVLKLEMIERQDPDYPEVTYEEWYYTTLNPGVTDIAITVGNQAIRNTVTVKSWNDIDASSLRFQQHEAVWLSGSVMSNNAFDDQFVEGRTSVHDSCYVQSSNPRIVFNRNWESADLSEKIDLSASPVVAGEPGTAKLTLYFYNPDTGKSTAVDSMTIKVVEPSRNFTSTTVQSFAGSAFRPSNDATEQFLNEHALSVSAIPKTLDRIEEENVRENASVSSDKLLTSFEVKLIDQQSKVFDGQVP